MLKLHQIRQEYRLHALDICDLDQNPLLQFKRWFQEALNAQIPEANAMALATANDSGRPSCRMILLKAVDDRGLIFFTNIQSHKGKDLASNPYACATFYWHELERQIIVDGPVEPLAKLESESYFATRPRGSQIGAWASHQDQVLESRAELETAYHHYEQEFAETLVPMPNYWGGYRLKPERMEFWQGRPNRLHDRFQYVLSDQAWKIHRLAP